VQKIKERSHAKIKYYNRNKEIGIK